ncbi:unnamed protein product [Phytophthora fragariaefolia]|uniref:Unnamed protein product n=1 Tax=Phytophthora fragariaefolia TaxID=1490495 RepID=A0A9W6Y529_9STRA|nr:unnamed protein product [Phytophthora fragariaefolia]
MREFIQRMDDNSVPPRLIWSNLLRAPEIPSPVLGFPSCAQILRNVKYNMWLQGTKNCILKTRQLVRSKVFASGMNPETAFVFGNREDDEGFPFVGNGQDEEPLILCITSLKLMMDIVALQARESFLIFHLDVTFKLSDLGYPVIRFTDRSRNYHLGAVFIVSQRTQHEYYEALGAFARTFHKYTSFTLRVDAIMGDAEAAQLNGLRRIREFSTSPFYMFFTMSASVYSISLTRKEELYTVEF